MPRSKSLTYNDEQLRILVCISLYGPHSLTDLMLRTGMKRSNLSAEITNLLSRGVLKRDKLTQIRSRHPGRPREYLALVSSWTIQSVCDELEYRKYQHESEIKKLDSSINNEFWVDWDKIANDPNECKRKDFSDKYLNIMLERINLGGEKGSSAPKATLQDIDGEPTIVIDPSGNARNLPKEISYQGIKYWLRLLQSPTIKLLGFLMDNAPKEHSIQEIAEGTNLEEDTL